MIRLLTLGAIDLRREQSEVGSVLSQPKRLALLIHLASAMPRGLRSREELLALFWPEADAEKARNALRQSLHYLRRSLGEACIPARDDGFVGVDRASVWCDAVEFDEAIDQGRYEEALELYRGDFMGGFFVDDAPGLERWIEDERARRRRFAVRAATSPADRAEEAGALRAAIEHTHRARELAPHDEATVRRLITLYARAGEASAALDAFSAFERRLAADYDLEPAEETRDLVARIAAGDLGNDAAVASAPAASEPPAPITIAPPAGDEAGRMRRSTDRKRRLRRPAVAALAALALIVATVAGMYARQRVNQRSSSAASRSPTIAVLPFVNMSSDPENEYFSDGITEEILNALAQVDGLRVAARTSSFAFRNQIASIDSIGRALRVAHVLEGSVRRTGTRLKITAQLIGTADGYHIWSDVYDRDATDVFAVQEEIAHAIAAALQPRLSSAPPPTVPRRTVVDPIAYDLYLRGRHLVSAIVEEENREAVDAFAMAIARDSTFALAHAGLARALIAMAEFVPPREVLPRAKGAALRVLALDSTLVETRLALADVRQVFDRDWGAAEREIQHAIALDPGSAEAHAAYADFLMRSRRLDEARAERSRAWQILREATPDSLQRAFRVAQHLSWGSFALQAGDADEATAHARAALALEPADLTARWLLAQAQLVLARPGDAVKELQKVRDLSTGSPYLALLGHAYGRDGRIADARAILDTLELRATRRYVPKDQIALVHLGLADTTAALDWLERAVDDYHWWMPNANSHPVGEGLRRLPRFRAVLRRIGAPAEGAADASSVVEAELLRQ